MRILTHPPFRNQISNPYNSLLYSNMRAEVVEYSTREFLTRKFDIFHVHWPEGALNGGSLPAAILKSIKLFAAMDIQRARGCRIVWTVHNLAPHESHHASLKQWFYRNLLKRIDGYLVLSQTGLELAGEKFPPLLSLPARVTVHGHYRDVYPVTMAAADARKLLGLPAQAKVLLFFGKVRAYKNVPSLIRIFRSLEDPELRLVVVGSPSNESIAREIREAAEDDQRIVIISDHVPDSEIPKYFAAADLVVLPYKDVLNSGAALLALTFNRPILVPNLGAMPELRHLVGDNWVRTFDGSLDPSHLSDALNWSKSRASDTCTELSKLDWQVIAGQTLNFFTELAGGTNNPVSAEGY